MGKPWENRSEYPDPTARKGEKAISAEDKRIADLMHCIRYVARVAGFEILNRVELRDLKTHRIYK